ncbi:MAG: Ig-like domain repeat protein, partial [Xanthomonadales bacterium]|nr:Ig-like domain repeat protein [Xanthomonadales bacterium]
MTSLPHRGLLLGLLLMPAWAQAGAFIFSDGSSPNLIAHPIGYLGVGGPRNVTVCLNPSGVPGGNVAAAEASVQKVVATWNAQRVSERNLGLGTANDLPSTQFDFESVLLHEMGHCLGLAHPNLASESGLNDPQANGTKSDVGSNGSFNVSAGSDGLFGSFDDARGDDINLYWYRRNVNRPLEFPAIIDGSTFARTGNLPAGHNFAANADRQVLAALGTANTESVMQQLTFHDEAQRRLTGEDLSTIRLGRSGVDMVQGTADDYTITLEYVGRTSSCDVDIAFVSGAGFAFCSVGGAIVATNHARITTADIRMDSGANWFFSTGPNTQTTITSDSPDPSSPGQPYTVAVSVTKTLSVPNGTPSGMVEIDDGQGASCSLTLNGSGQGSCQLTSSGSGSRTLTANYLGDLGFDASSGTATHGLGVPTTTAILSDLPDPSVVGQPYNVQIQV